MKIKNLKYALGMISLSTTLALTGCGLKNHKEEVEVSIESLEESEILETESDYLVEETNLLYMEEIQQFEVETIEETVKETAAEIKEEKVILNSEQLEDLVEELKSELGTSVTFSTYCNLDNISIFISSNHDKDIKCEFSDDLYSNFNLLLSQDYSYCLSLYEIGSEIDFSKLDLSSINELHLESCKENFNYDTFTKVGYDKLSLVDVPFEKAKIIVDGCTNNELELEYFNYKNENNDNLEFVRFLVENNICLGLYSGIDISHQEDEIYSLLSCLNAREVMISEINVDGNQASSILDMNLKLNDRIEKFYIFDYHYRELGDIKILSSNPDFCLDLKYVKITDNTNFSLPDNSSLEMAGIYTDIEAFYDLINISELSYYDCEFKESIYGYKQIFDKTLNKIKAIHGNALVK